MNYDDHTNRGVISYTFLFFAFSPYLLTDLEDRALS